MKIEKEEIKPVCPFCEAKLDRLTQVKTGWFAENRIFCCPRCHKVLGIAHSH